MREFFARPNRLVFDLGDKGRRERFFYHIVFAVTFFAGAFLFWEFMYELWNMIGAAASGSPEKALEDFLRMLPLTLTGFTLIYIAIFTHNAYRAGSAASRRNKWKAGGIVTIVMGLVIAGYIITGLVRGEYASVVEGYLTPLFPLDVMIGAVLFIVFGFVSLNYARLLREEPRELNYVNDLSRSGRRLWVFGPLKLVSLLFGLFHYVEKLVNVSGNPDDIKPLWCYMTGIILLMGLALFLCYKSIP